MKKSQGKKVRTGRAVLAYVSAVCVVLLAIGGTSYGQTAGDIIVPSGYQAEILVNAPEGLRFNDVAVTPWGELIVSLVAESRAPCESFIASVSMDGDVSAFADVCIDNPMAMAFGPDTGDLLYFVERGGYWDYIYTVPSYGAPHGVKLIASGFIQPSDIEFSQDGDLYVSELYDGIIYIIDPAGGKRVFRRGFNAARARPPVRNGLAFEMAFNSEGVLFVSDASAHAIYRITTDGSMSTFISEPSARPGSLAFAPNGDLFVADIATGSIYTITPSGVPSVFATGLKSAVGMAFGPDGALYVLEWLDISYIWTDTRVIKISRSTVPADVDVKPETLNLKSKGKVVTCHIELPEGSNIGDVIIDSVAITAVDGVTLGQPLEAVSPASTGDYDGDGVPDLMVKFGRQALIPLLGPGNAEITVTGELADGSAFEGSDTIKTK